MLPFYPPAWWKPFRVFYLLYKLAHVYNWYISRRIIALMCCFSCLPSQKKKHLVHCKRLSCSQADLSCEFQGGFYYLLCCLTETDLRSDLVIGNPQLSSFLVYTCDVGNKSSFATSMALATKLQTFFYQFVLELFKVCLQAKPALVPEVMSSCYLYNGLFSVFAFLSRIMFWPG